MIDAPVKRLVPWYGSKATLGKTIAAQLGKHQQYFEPFAGSLAPLFSKTQVPFETVNDLHGDLINLARVVQTERTAFELYRRVDRFLFCEPAIADAIERIREPLMCELDAYSPAAVDRAVDYFVVSWTARNGMAGLARPDFQIAVRWNTGGGSPTVRFRSSVDSVPAWHRRLQGVVILRRDAFAIIPRFADDDGTAVYVDAP